VIKLRGRKGKSCCLAVSRSRFGDTEAALSKNFDLVKIKGGGNGLLDNVLGLFELILGVFQVSFTVTGQSFREDSQLHSRSSSDSKLTHAVGPFQLRIGCFQA